MHSFNWTKTAWRLQTFIWSGCSLAGYLCLVLLFSSWNTCHSEDGQLCFVLPSCGWRPFFDPVVLWEQTFVWFCCSVAGDCCLILLFSDGWPLFGPAVFKLDTCHSEDGQLCFVLLSCGWRPFFDHVVLWEQTFVWFCCSVAENLCLDLLICGQIAFFGPAVLQLERFVWSCCSMT